MEFVFVIIIVGIISSILIKDSKPTKLYEAATQLVSDIKYTQHLAMTDDKFDTSDKDWFKERWQLLFGKSSSKSLNSGGYYAYSIFSDASGNKSGNPDPKEIAKNPLDSSKVLSGGFSGTLDWEDLSATKRLNIGYKYNIDNVKQQGCGAKRISFDHMGRPLKGDSSNWDSSVSGVLTKQCRIILYQGNSSVAIVIEPETGYIHIE